MCGKKSNHGAKGIVLLFLIFLLAVSPCWSASPWQGLASLLGVKAHTEQENPTSYQGSEASYQEVASKESCQTEYTEPSQIPDPQALEELKEAVESLKTEYMSYQEALADAKSRLNELNSTSSLLQEQLEGLKETEMISEAEYTAVKESLVANIESNKGADDIIASYQSQLEKEKAKNGTRGFLSLNAVIGFNNDIPEYGFGLSIGMRMGSHVMLTAGADYMIGNFNGNFYLNGLDINKLKITCGIGWMF